MGVLLLFFDGVGIAPAAEWNPITEFPGQPFPIAESDDVMKSGLLIHTDATLGIEGLPQSATGQATLLTGKNAARLEGRHVNAFPTTTLRTLITAHSLFRRLWQRGLHPLFANAYHSGYFARRHSRFSVSTWSWLAARIQYSTLEDLQEGTAVSHDLTNEFMNRLGFQVPVRRPSQAGRILVELLREYDFVFGEYILTDVIGHRQDYSEAVRRLGQIRELFTSILDHLDNAAHQVILTSDHGNLEDLSTNTHTRNPVPTILWGKPIRNTDIKVRSLEDIAPLILRLLPAEKSSVN